MKNGNEKNQKKDKSGDNKSGTKKIPFVPAPLPAGMPKPVVPHATDNTLVVISAANGTAILHSGLIILLYGQNANLQSQWLVYEPQTVTANVPDPQYFALNPGFPGNTITCINYPNDGNTAINFDFIKV